MEPPEAQFELALIEVFSDLADLFGNPRSHGQIYGLLFARTDPMTMEEIAGQLKISMGSASNGLRTLEAFGAVEKLDAETARGQAHYRARLQLRPLVEGFIENRLAPKLQASNDRLQTLAELLPQLPPERLDQAGLRLERVTNWHRRATKALSATEALIKLIR